MGPHLSNDEFFSNLTSLLSTLTSKAHGSIYLTQKRLSFSSSGTPSDPAPATSDPSTTTPSKILIRATNGKSKPHRKQGEKVKISTIVEVGELEGFYARYAEVCKRGMEGLKRRDRSGRRKKRDKKRKGEGKGDGKA